MINQSPSSRRQHRSRCLCLAAALCLLLCMCANGNSAADDIDLTPYTTEWHDTLTNASAAVPELKPMDAEIRRFMSRWDLRGTSLAVTRHDSLVYARGYGWADVENRTPMEATTVMRIASASKLVTAIAIMQLVEQGKLALDSKIFGPDGILNDSLYTSAIADPRACDVTVDHLLLHMGGFARPWGDPMFHVADIVKANRLPGAPSPDELTRIILRRKMSRTPGESRKYSNFGYMLLSLVIEKVSGTDYWDYVQQNIFEPSGIGGFKAAGNYLADRYPDEARYYGPDKVKVEEYTGSGRMVERVYGGNNVNGLLGAGGWLASAPGLARLVAVTDSCPGVRNILTPASTAILTAYDPEETMCRGWVEIDDDGNWLRTGTLSSTHVLIKHYADGQCWVMTTNTGVWIGHKFSSDMNRLFDALHAKYSDVLPHRSLW